MQNPHTHYGFLIILSASFLGLWVFYTLMPQLDIRLSGHFFDAAHPERFPLMYDPLMRFIQKGVHWVAYVVIAVPALAIILHHMKLHHWNRFGLSNRSAAFLLLSLALGPGLVVHGIFKEGFERPRPVHSDVFGGEYVYVPPMVIGNDTGKSFVSGHAATGFFFCAFALLAATRRWQLALYAAGIGFGIFLGACRIVQGRHFLSDVLFSGVVTLICVHIAYLICCVQRHVKH
jgi:lipid A 4'-phosphatase